MKTHVVRKALVLAAGRGRPVADLETPNCLAEVAGTPLVARTLRTLRKAGIERVGFVTGWHANTLRAGVAAVVAGHPDLQGLQVGYFHNPDWDAPNGLSVQAARAFFDEPLLLVMADQIAAQHLVSGMVRIGAGASEIVLAVDREISRVFDLDDATKVKLAGDGRVAGISKELADYEAISAGLFVTTPALLACLDELPQPSLTEGVALAARRGLVRAHDVQGALWQDVDSPDMRLHADWLLRVHGAELAHPVVAAPARSPAADTLALVDRLLAEKDVPRYTLLNPGPVMTSARVKAALVHHDLCHRDADYSTVVARLGAKLRPLFRGTAAHEVVLLTGSGTSAMEMAISSVVPPGRKILVVVNGAFGERMVEIAQTWGLPVVVQRHPWGEIADADQVAATLASDPDIAVVAMIHHETSVGILNPVEAVGKACAVHDRLLIVDAVSSLGVEDLDVVRDHIDLCYASANKCLHAVAGVSFVCVSPRVWPRLGGFPARSLYLNLTRYREYMSTLSQTPFTPAVSASLALETALDELAEDGGVPARAAKYRWRNLRIRQVMAGLGFQSFTNTGKESASISTMKVPPVISAAELYDRLKARGFIAYRCKGALADEYMQVANMGELSHAAIDDFLAAVTEIVEAARAAAPVAARRVG